MRPDMLPQVLVRLLLLLLLLLVPRRLLVATAVTAVGLIAALRISVFLHAFPPCTQEWIVSDLPLSCERRPGTESERRPPTTARHSGRGSGQRRRQLGLLLPLEGYAGAVAPATQAVAEQ